jgi:hypothetical protein
MSQKSDNLEMTCHPHYYVFMPGDCAWLALQPWSFLHCVTCYVTSIICNTYLKNLRINFSNCVIFVFTLFRIFMALYIFKEYYFLRRVLCFIVGVVYMSENTLYLSICIFTCSRDHPSTQQLEAFVWHYRQKPAAESRNNMSRSLFWLCVNDAAAAASMNGLCARVRLNSRADIWMYLGWMHWEPYP